MMLFKCTAESDNKDVQPSLSNRWVSISLFGRTLETLPQLSSSPGGGRFEVVKRANGRPAGGFAARTLVSFPDRTVFVKELKPTTEEEVRAVEREKSILHELQKEDHENVVGFFGATMSSVDVYHLHFSATFGDIVDCQITQSPRDIETMLDQMNKVVRFLHSKGIAHGDIKPRNVLETVTVATGVKTFKLTDFGLARDIEQSENGQLSDMPTQGTPPFIPFLVRRFIKWSDNYNFSQDTLYVLKSWELRRAMDVYALKMMEEQLMRPYSELVAWTNSKIAPSTGHKKALAEMYEAIRKQQSRKDKQIITDEEIINQFQQGDMSSILERLNLLYIRFFLKPHVSSLRWKKTIGFIENLMKAIIDNLLGEHTAEIIIEQAQNPEPEFPSVSLCN